MSNFSQRYLRRRDIRGQSLLVSPIVKRRKKFTAQIDDLPRSPKRKVEALKNAFWTKRRLMLVALHQVAMAKMLGYGET